MKVLNQILPKEQVIKSISKQKTVWKVLGNTYFNATENLIIQYFCLYIYFGGVLKVLPQWC